MTETDSSSGELSEKRKKEKQLCALLNSKTEKCKTVFTLMQNNKHRLYHQQSSAKGIFYISAINRCFFNFPFEEKSLEIIMVLNCTAVKYIGTDKL